MNYSRSLFTLGAAFLLAVSPTLSAQEATAKGVNYLVGQQAENGSWSAEEKLRLTDSTESFLALRRANGGENALNKSLQFFSALTEENNETLATKLLTLSSSTATIDIYINKLIADQKTDGGWGIADSKTGSIPHTLLSINALLTSKKASNSIISNGVAFLIQNQQVNGSWIFSGEHSLSDTAHTAMVLVTLKNVQNANSYSGSGLEQAIAKAQQYIQGKADDDGSYGDLLDTAWTYLAFSLIKQPSELQKTLSFISSSQKENGSWNNQVYDTAVCLQALTAIQTPQTDLPDLEITETNIFFNPTAPLTGNEVSITAIVFNKGEVDAENVKVEFFNRDPRLSGVEIATSKTVPVVPAGGSVTISSSFITTGMVGAQQIVVFIDRENAINEVTKVNNAAAKMLSIGGMPDLAISTDDITLSNPNPKAFENVDLIISINNIGNEAVQNIPVKIFDNDKLFYEFILSGVNAGSSNKAIVTTGFSAEAHTIRVEVDPDHTITSEINMANNIASKSFTVEAEPEKPIDLAVLAIETDPAAPLSTAPTKITVTVANLGGQDVTAAFAVVLNVDGAAKGTINVPQLLKGQRAVLEFTGIMLTAGERIVAAVADSGNVITADTERGNNTLSKTITVRDSSTPVDLEIATFTATPATATVGGTVSFKVVVTNKGTTTAENVDVKLFNGTTAISSVKVPRLVGGQSGELQFEYAFSTNGNYTIRAVADPDNKITESDKTNNEKSAVVAVTGATDLEITTAGIVLSADSVTAFQQFEITAIIKNIGNMDALNVPVRFIANGTTLATINLSGVAAGSSNKAILKTSLAKGTYNITISIDPDKTLANEHNLTNNVAYKSLAVTAPATSLADLAVTSLVIDPALPIANTPANLTATIANIGGTDIATAFSVEFKDNETVLHTFTVPGLAAGQKAELKLTANLTAGDHTVVVTADSGNVITSEATKANNSASKQLSVASDATPVDLQVASVTLDKSSPNVMDKVVVTASIYNAGTTAAGSFFIRIMANGTAVGEDYRVTGLAGGGTFNLQIPYTINKEGDNVIQIIADSQNNVEESDKANNTGSVNFSASTIARPDLTILDGGLATNPENPQPSVGFEYKITVSNTGNQASTAAKLLVTEGHPQMAGAIKLGEAAIPAIEAGKKVTVSVNLTLSESKENIFVFVDSNDDVAESNEDNNLFKTSITVANLPDLMADKNAITLSHTDLAKGNVVEVKAMVANIGSVNATAVKGRFIDRRVGGATYLIGEVSIPAIAAGASVEVKTLWSATAGAHTVVFEIDYDNTLQEASKSNNIAEKDVNMLVPETTMRILKKNTESGELVVGNQFSANETVYFEVLHGYSDAKLAGVIEDAEENLYRVVSQDGLLSFNTSYYAPGTYVGYIAIVNRDTGVVLDEIQGTFEILPTKALKSITAVPNPKYATVDENVALKMMGEVVNGSNQPIPGTLTFSLIAPNGVKAFEDKVHEVTIQPLHFYFRYTHPEFAFAFAEVGEYTLTTTLVTELGTLTNSAKIPVYETPPAALTPATLDMSLPLGEQILKQIEMARGGGTTGEIFDVVFMFDTTGSYGELVYQFGQQSMSIMEAIKEQLGNNVQFGIASFADYPFYSWGEYDDYAYRIDHVLTSNMQAIRDTFQNTYWWYGGWDGPESQLEALYQLATGKGRDVDQNGSYDDHGDVKPSNIGWRQGSTRIVFFGTDVSFHRGGEPVFGEGEPQEWWTKPYYYPGPTWDETVNALVDNGITVVGLVPGWGDIPDVNNILIDTGSVHRNGDPLTFTFDHSGAQISSEVLSAIELSASALRFTVRAVNDEMGFFVGVEPERLTIYPDEKASFELKFKGAVEPGAVDQIFTFELELVTGSGRVIGRIPVSILVPQKTPLTVKTDKTQYVIGENTVVTVNLEMTPNAMKTISTPEDLKKGTFDRTNATVEPGKIVLDIAGVSDPKNQILKGDFEDWEYWGPWKSTYFYDYNSYIEIMWDASDWEKISGSMSMFLEGHYDFWEQAAPSGASASIYQDVTVPGDALSAILSWKDRGRYYGKNYKVQIRDKENNVLRTVFVGENDDWNITSHEVDVKEYLGKEIRLAFVFQPVDYSQYCWMSVQIDDVSLGVTYPGYYPTGTANLIVDAEAPVMWDKFTYEADTTVEGTSVAVRYRTAESLGALENAEFSAATDASDVKIASAEPLRYLEVQFILNTLDDLKTPKVTKLHATYCKYSNADNARLKVVIEDKDGNQVKQLADFLPQIELGLKQEFKYDFNTTGHEPGDYKAVGRLYINGDLESKGEADFKLITDAVASLLESGVTTDKLEYIGNETVQITSRVRNTSSNANLTNLSVLVEVKDSTNTVLQSYSYVVDSLLKGSINDKALQFSISNDAGVGPYVVTQTVTMEGIEPLVKTAPFMVKANVELGKGLTGTLTPQPFTVKRRIGDLDFAITAANDGNVDLNDVVFKVTIYDPVTLAVLKTISTTSVAMQKSGTHSSILSYGGKVELMPGTYPATLTAEFTYGGSAQKITLNTAGFVVTNTAPVANAGTTQPLEGTALPMSVALDGSGSTDENSTDEAKRNDIVKYEWTLGGTVLDTGMNSNVSLGLGEHTITLTVTDTCGATSSDTVKITIKDTTPPVITDIVPVNDSQHKTVEKITAKVSDSCSGIDYSTLAVKIGETTLTTTYNEETGAISATVPSGLVDGWQNASITVSDKAGNKSSATWRFLTDATAPVISDMVPVNSSASENKSPEISAKITDATSGVDASTIVLKVNGTTVTHSWDVATGKVSINASDLAVGTHTVSLTVSDKVGNEASASWSFTVTATAAPGLTGTLTLAPETVKRRVGDLSLTAAASNSGNVALSGITFTVKVFSPDGSETLKEFSGSGDLALEETYSKVHPYGAKVDLMPGTYPAVLTATYTIGGTTKTVTLDTKNITVTNTAPIAEAGADQEISATATSTEITLNGSASTDENSTDAAKKNDIAKYEWKNGETVLGEGETLKVNLPLGEHTLTLVVTDTCGATGTDTVKITIADKTPPVITNLTPAHESEITEKSPEISAIATDALSGVDPATIVLKIDGTTVTHVWTESTSKVSFAASNLSEAVHNVSLTVKDKAGNEASASWSFTVKAPAVLGLTGTLTLAPETVKRRIGDLSLTAAAGNSGNVALSDVTFIVKIYNPAGDTVLKEFSEVGQLPVEGTYSKVHAYGKVDLMPGTYPAILTATYTHDGTAKTVTLDTKNIVVTNTAPVAEAGADQEISAMATSTEITLNGSASTDENSTDAAKKNDIAKYEWKNGETVLGEGETLKVNLPLGEYTLTLTVTDTCGATGTDTVKITVADKTAPVITELTPADQSEIEEKSPVVSAKITDAVSGVDAATIVLKIDNTTVTHTWDAAAGKVSFSTSNLSEAVHNVSLTVKDKAGNEASATWSFTVKAASTGGGDFLIFSNSRNQGIQFSGTLIQVNGRAHTNNNFASWSNTTNIQTVTATGQINGSGNVTITNRTPNASTEPIPVYDFEYYRTNANYTHNGNWQIGWNEVVPAGIHYVNGSVMIPQDLNADVTIVATGDIQFSATTLTLRSPDTKNRMALFSRDGAIRIYGNSCTVYGILYAPKGAIHMGSTTKNIFGGLIGDTVENYSGTLTVSKYQQP